MAENFPLGNTIEQIRWLELFLKEYKSVNNQYPPRVSSRLLNIEENYDLWSFI